MSAHKTRTAAMTAATMPVALLIFVWSAPLQAQDAGQNDINARLLACDKLPHSSDRLACFNDVAASLKQKPSEPAVSVPTEPTPDPSPEPVTASESRPPAAQATPEPAAAPPDAEVDDFGRDSMPVDRQAREKEKKKDAEEIQATIVRSWRNHDERFSVELDNGQVWRETPGKTRYGLLPKEGRSVKIYVGGFGGYRMKVDGIPRVAWVRRTK